MARPESSANNNSVLLEGLENLKKETEKKEAAKQPVQKKKAAIEKYSEKMLLSLTPTTAEAIKEYAASHHTKPTEVVRQAIYSYLGI